MYITKLLGNEKATSVVFTDTGMGMIVAHQIREEDNEKPDAIIVIPYVAGLEDAIRRTCNKFNIRIVFRSNTLKSTLLKEKDPLPTKLQANVVYQVPSIVG